MVIMDQPTFPGCVITARPIGMLEMIDGGDRDEKILCVPAKDPRYAEVKSLKDSLPIACRKSPSFSKPIRI